MGPSCPALTFDTLPDLTSSTSIDVLLYSRPFNATAAVSLFVMLEDRPTTLSIGFMNIANGSTSAIFVIFANVKPLIYVQIASR
jgi:hypothetical protein